MNQFSSENLWWSHSQPTSTTSPLSSKYKGVIPQPNGRWGAQIFENNHRLWLGTFDSQEAAALSYDRAASMFRPSDSNPNFHHQQSPASAPPETDNEEAGEDADEREHMFEKPLTPSDVGKLNRLVIPKQHAEKYFPLGGGNSGDEKGLLLSFEDETGKLWRFRYSYWNSSQSYVLTKGWSRFVKEKQLDAGDVVWFERRRLDLQQLYIRWRRRLLPSSLMASSAPPPPPPQLQQSLNRTTTPAWTQVFYSAHPHHHPYPSHHHLPGPLLYQQPDCLHATEPVVVENVKRPAANSKRLRLFGVNLDCQLDECDEASRSDGSSQNRNQDCSDQSRYDRGRDLSM